ncbi:putative membrane protein [Arthrobacter sp. B1I2]|nr:putative membrane protein [Arthrobacter sp. B1I2]
MIPASLLFAQGSWRLARGRPMLLAAAVLAFTGRKYLRAALTQGTTPLLAVVLGLLATLP